MFLLLEALDRGLKRLGMHPDRGSQTKQWEKSTQNGEVKWEAETRGIWEVPSVSLAHILRTSTLDNFSTLCI